MKILISDDCDLKSETIKELILHCYPNADITRVNYAKAGVNELKKNNYDYLIQDMFLPLHSDDIIDRKGGIYVLNQIKYGDIKIKHCICSSDKISYQYMVEASYSNIPFLDFSSYYFEEDLISFLKEKLC